MPSYRCTVEILELRPGHAPEEVMDAAVSGVAGGHLVEANQLDLARGVPVIRVRFLVDPTNASQEDADSRDAARDMSGALGPVARHGPLRITRRERGRWLPVVG